jgi:hypothetical protein
MIVGELEMCPQALELVLAEALEGEPLGLLEAPEPLERPLPLDALMERVEDFLHQQRMHAFVPVRMASSMSRASIENFVAFGYVPDMYRPQAE